MRSFAFAVELSSSILLRAVSVMPSSDLVVWVIIPSVTAVAISLTCVKMKTSDMIESVIVLNCK